MERVDEVTEVTSRYPRALSNKIQEPQRKPAIISPVSYEIAAPHGVSNVELTSTLHYVPANGAGDPTFLDEPIAVHTRIPQRYVELTRHWVTD